MKLRHIVEDFEKAISAAKYLRDKISIILRQVPDGHRPFLISNTLANNQSILQDLSPEESDVVFTTLGRFYNIPGDELSKLTYDRVRDEEGETARKQQMWKGHTSQDVLGNMGVAMGSPDLRQKSLASEPSSEPQPDQSPTPETGSPFPPMHPATPEYPYTHLKRKSATSPAGGDWGSDESVSRPPKPPTRIDMLKAGHSLADIADKFGESFLNYHQMVAESLYGNIVRPGESLIDNFINAVDTMYIDFDPHNPKFQKLAERIFGKIPDAEEWISLLVSSRQNTSLKEKLAQIIAASETGADASRHAISGVAPNINQPLSPAWPSSSSSGSGAKYQPTLGLGEAADVTFERGTVVKADHCVITIKANGQHPYLLMGVGPGAAYQRFTKSGPQKYALHPDFLKLIKRENAGYPHDPSSTHLLIESNFKKTMSANLKNVKHIQTRSGRTYDKAQLMRVRVKLLYNSGGPTP